ncbi:MAG: SRPBCC domain-containing protein [Agriterribacter sp.]
MKPGNLVATVLVGRPLDIVWEKWITPADIKQWNIPFDNWCCPIVENKVEDGGRFFFRMETKDGREGFDHKGKYDEVIPLQYIKYTQDDGRKSVIEFQQIDQNTIVRESFEPEKLVPNEMQQEFCQSVLQRFKEYVEQDELIK